MSMKVTTIARVNYAQLEHIDITFLTHNTGTCLVEKYSSMD